MYSLPEHNTATQLTICAHCLNTTQPLGAQYMSSLLDTAQRFYFTDIKVYIYLCTFLCVYILLLLLSCFGSSLYILLLSMIPSSFCTLTIQLSHINTVQLPGPIILPHYLNRAQLSGPTICPHCLKKA